MHHETSLDKIKSHQLIWDFCRPWFVTQTFPQALLFLGPKHAGMFNFSYRFIARMFCASQQDEPCGICRSCLAIHAETHPDIVTIMREEGASAIKIEQIRSLHDIACQTPTWEKYRVVLLYPLDFLNLASSNALLKLLEEPPKHLIFILISEHYRVLPTILSRCQRLFFHSSESYRELNFNYLNIAQHYPQTSVRFQMHDAQLLCDSVQALLENQISICQAALQWQKIELDDVVWLFYLFTATCIMQIKLGVPKQSEYSKLIYILCERYKQPMHLYAILDKVVSFMHDLKQNVNLNRDLVVETLFLSFIEAPYAYSF